MDEQLSAQALGKRHIVASLDRAFARLHAGSCDIVQRAAIEQLYEPRGAVLSIGESVLRSAAVIEQTFGGITANLWDDPFEWTLPEHLTTPAKVMEHLEEVEAVRRRAFASFTDDSCLTKQIATPTHQSQALIDLLLDTLQRATTCQGQAGDKFVSRSDARGFII
ncbi:MAG TPA: hypothetical protein VJV03_11250 [Pyrinomonadaceae bacterium]|nr:hypothetical protein [Pyrinomonadaceae bacterium]